MYAIVDIETTGGHASAHGITEIAIIVYDGEKIIREYETLINPLQPIPKFISSLTGISNAMVASAPRFDEVAHEISEILEGNIFVAHNVNFDHSFLKVKLGECGYSLNGKKLCTVRLARKTFPGLPSYSLGNICRELNINVTHRHRAGGDARATARLLHLILSSGGRLHVNEMLKRNSGEQWLPTHLDRKIITRLPGKPGVYYFHDQKKKVIYVGKAVNLKKRVTSHFTGTDGGNRRQQFLRKIHDITYRECVDELHALVLESTEIRRLWPAYNYSQKKAAPAFGLYSYEDSRGFLRLVIDRRRKHLEALYRFNLLQEGKAMLRKIASEFEIDPAMCFLDPLTETVSCTDHRYHNEKVRKAIEALDAKLRTFSVVSPAPDGRQLCLLIERGGFYGMGYLNGEPGSVSELKEKLDPFPDNDFIRNSIFSFAERNPGMVRDWKE